MNKIKKISSVFLLSLGFILVIGFWTIKTSLLMTSLLSESLNSVSIPAIHNPVPQCRECIETRGVNSKCVTVCLQEVVFNGLTPRLVCLSEK